MTSAKYKSTPSLPTKDNIREFFESGEDRIEFDLASPVMLYDLAQEAGGEPDMDEADTNGYQVDYWIPCLYKGVKYCLHGSAWYGNAEIYKDEDE